VLLRTIENHPPGIELAGMVSGYTKGTYLVKGKQDNGIYAAKVVVR
jgi:hypothetical protein